MIATPLPPPFEPQNVPVPLLAPQIPFDLTESIGAPLPALGMSARRRWMIVCSVLAATLVLTVLAGHKILRSKVRPRATRSLLVPSSLDLRPQPRQHASCRPRFQRQPQRRRPLRPPAAPPPPPQPSPPPNHATAPAKPTHAPPSRPPSPPPAAPLRTHLHHHRRPRPRPLPLRRPRPAPVQKPKPAADQFGI